mgnify:CR=1 FL=1
MPISAKIRSELAISLWPGTKICNPGLTAAGLAIGVGEKYLLPGNSVWIHHFSPDARRKW